MANLINKQSEASCMGFNQDAETIIDLDQYIVHGRLKIKVIPNCSRTKLQEENFQLKLYLKAVPEKNKANQELIKFFKKKYQLNVEIVSGGKSRTKLLLVSLSPLR